MHLIEILLPVADNEGQRFDARKYEEVRQDLSRRFGGITTFTRAPAHGTSEAKGEIVHDDIVVFEVMTDTLDRPWWEAYRRRLEQSFSQDENKVQFGGHRGRVLRLKAGDVAVLPAGTGHQCLGASDDFLVVGAYPPSGTYDECKSSKDHKCALTTISKVGRPRRDPVYGTKGPLLSVWPSKR